MGILDHYNFSDWLPGSPAHSNLMSDINSHSLVVNTDEPPNKRARLGKASDVTITSSEHPMQKNVRPKFSFRTDNVDYLKKVESVARAYIDLLGRRHDYDSGDYKGFKAVSKEEADKFIDEVTNFSVTQTHKAELLRLEIENLTRGLEKIQETSDDHLKSVQRCLGLLYSHKRRRELEEQEEKAKKG